jgi:hypothetical protein
MKNYTLQFWALLFLFLAYVFFTNTIKMEK